MAESHSRRPLLIVAIIVGLTVGAAGGIGLYTFVYARGMSYFTNDPKACANCHVMQGHLDAWAKSSHHAVAVCNDCHTPHDIARKYYVKGVNGYHHSLAFTTGNFHEPIEITDFNHKVTEEACRRCHGKMVEAIDHTPKDGEKLTCTRCHENVGHME